MGRVYAGDRGTEIRLFLGDVTAEELAAAVNPVISVKRPDGTIATWSATVDGTTLELVYVTQSGDLSQIGEYLLQAVPNLPSWVGRGETARLRVYAEFAV